LEGTRNNQPNDGVGGGGGCIGEEMRPGRNVWVGRLPIVWGGTWSNEKREKWAAPWPSMAAI
jgi:hypothetical protein